MAYNETQYFITTTNGHRVNFSENDWETALSQCWTRTTDGYAKRYHEKSVNGKRLRWVNYFHRAIMNPKKDEIIDHINQDKLDNRRENLRVANKSVNALNTDKNKGYTIRKLVDGSLRYDVRLVVNGKNILSKTYTSKLDAIEAYHKKKKEAINV